LCQRLYESLVKIHGSSGVQFFNSRSKLATPLEVLRQKIPGSSIDLQSILFGRILVRSGRPESKQVSDTALHHLLIIICNRHLVSSVADRVLAWVCVCLSTVSHHADSRLLCWFIGQQGKNLALFQLFHHVLHGHWRSMRGKSTIQSLIHWFQFTMFFASRCAHTISHLSDKSRAWRTKIQRIKG